MGSSELLLSEAKYTSERYITDWNLWDGNSIVSFLQMRAFYRKGPLGGPASVVSSHLQNYLLSMNFDRCNILSMEIKRCVVMQRHNNPTKIGEI